jgi:hypothetical protein
MPWTQQYAFLAGADFLRGDAHPPDEPALAAKEGWIWSRLRI